MDNANEHTTAAANSGKSIDYRRKRVNRLKAVIIIIVIICLILPTIFCILLGIQVHRLQSQMKDLIDIHQEYGLTYESDDSIDYAYAAEKPQATDGGIASSGLESILAGTDGQAESDSQAVAASSMLSPTDDLQPDALQTEEGTKESNLDPEQINSTANQDNSSAQKNPAEAKTSDDKKEPQTDGVYAGKKVYLTFDDGPSIYTGEILDILEDYHVKATFFVIGKTDEESKKLYQRIVEEGHTLGMHSYSHKYEKIYNSVKDFDKDFTKLWKLLYDTTGYKPSIYRFPGGSDNLVNRSGMENFISYLKDKSITYFDWNVVSGDATGIKYTKDQLIDNVLGGVALKNTSIVLMHDSQTKQTTVDSLPGLLEELIAGGAEILPLDKDVTPIQMIKADSVK